MKKLFFLLFVCHFGNTHGQKINPASIDIVRDSFGVPHIFANTDAEVAYGLAYAHAEDDFKTIQLGFLAGKSMLGLYKGKEGAQVDYIVQLFRCRKTVNEKYETDVAGDFKKILQGYCQGFNAYARTHPKEVLVNKLLPLTPQDMLAYSMLQLAISSGADGALRKIYNGSVPTLDNFSSAGSNAYAFNSNKTADGNTFLNINAHQPLEGPVSWYEAHLCSNEGWNIIGALFPCAPTILLGCNENLGWAHTVNHPDKLDVYQLQVNPLNKLEYKFDNEWLQLEGENVNLHLKIAGITVRAKRKVYWSKYGPTIITPKGTFSIRTGPLFDIRSLEQWYRMNKATGFTSFYKALKMEALPGYNVVYADRYDTIFYLSNGKIPIRDKSFNWSTTIPGNSSKTLWTQYHPLEELPHYLNPSSGYLFNSNHSPFNASAMENNLNVNDVDPTMGYETWENNRSIRFMQLLKPLAKVSYEDFKTIKFDREFPAKLNYIRSSSDTLFLLNEKEHPAISDVIQILNSWDKKTGIDSKGATLFGIIFYYVSEKLKIGQEAYRDLTKEKSIEVLTFAKSYLLSHFGKTGVPLGDYQKLVRGNKVIPLAGLPDVIASMESTPFRNGMVKGLQGESYIELVKFTKAGPQIESIHNYGASNKPGNKHYDDQMEMFVEQKLKPMSLDKTTIYKKAESIYHPL
ncbi:MAG TPA: penicillin acylase family protein [Ferruginibacter sp.]|nr:penicillin acylase family protein [Ferruginibacter sp.]